MIQASTLLRPAGLIVLAQISPCQDALGQDSGVVSQPITEMLTLETEFHVSFVFLLEILKPEDNPKFRFAVSPLRDTASRFVETQARGNSNHGTAIVIIMSSVPCTYSSL